MFEVLHPLTLYRGYRDITYNGKYIYSVNDDLRNSLKQMLEFQRFHLLLIWSYSLNIQSSE
nr:MAG TPA: hypothetical protein [Caudoviricetes sp.]